ncbi:hypothetical protein TRFO_03085 [Tritrichomonas foetus]|uniref:Uncharacterized protein n=1 Tax=Tritrichomonas foetus TaxID=1144522 RepID=A0A1J4KYX7_9EUKA|nr:hypothetical protein TRFO_03085 [Tritrichomonas foetus]|eukprot:OHT14789.1 hypothetical protein TRFO_03085 [Tritrichomonas foetus]
MKMKNFFRIGALNNGPISAVYFDDDPIVQSPTGQIFIVIQGGGVLVMTISTEIVGNEVVAILSDLISFPTLFKDYNILDMQIFRIKAPKTLKKLKKELQAEAKNILHSFNSNSDSNDYEFFVEEIGKYLKEINEKIENKEAIFKKLILNLDKLSYTKKDIQNYCLKFDKNIKKKDEKDFSYVNISNLEKNEDFFSPINNFYQIWLKSCILAKSISDEEKSTCSLFCQCNELIKNIHNILEENKNPKNKKNQKSKPKSNNNEEEVDFKDIKEYSTRKEHKNKKAHKTQEEKTQNEPKNQDITEKDFDKDLNKLLKTKYMKIKEVFDSIKLKLKEFVEKPDTIINATIRKDIKIKDLIQKLQEKEQNIHQITKKMNDLHTTIIEFYNDNKFDLNKKLPLNSGTKFSHNTDPYCLNSFMFEKGMNDLKILIDGLKFKASKLIDAEKSLKSFVSHSRCIFEREKNEKDNFMIYNYLVFLAEDRIIRAYSKESPAAILTKLREKYHSNKNYENGKLTDFEYFYEIQIKPNKKDQDYIQTQGHNSSSKAQKKSGKKPKEKAKNAKEKYQISEQTTGKDKGKSNEKMKKEVIEKNKMQKTTTNKKAESKNMKTFTIDKKSKLIFKPPKFCPTIKLPSFYVVRYDKNDDVCKCVVIKFSDNKKEDPIVIQDYPKYQFMKQMKLNYYQITPSGMVIVQSRFGPNFGIAYEVSSFIMEEKYVDNQEIGKCLWKQDIEDYSVLPILSAHISPKSGLIIYNSMNIKIIDRSNADKESFDRLLQINNSIMIRKARKHLAMTKYQHLSAFFLLVVYAVNQWLKAESKPINEESEENSIVPILLNQSPDPISSQNHAKYKVESQTHIKTPNKTKTKNSTYKNKDKLTSSTNNEIKNPNHKDNEQLNEKSPKLDIDQAKKAVDDLILSAPCSKMRVYLFLLNEEELNEKINFVLTKKENDGKLLNKFRQFRIEFLQTYVLRSINPKFTRQLSALFLMILDEKIQDYVFNSTDEKLINIKQFTKDYLSVLPSMDSALYITKCYPILDATSFVYDTYDFESLNYNKTQVLTEKALSKIQTYLITANYDHMINSINSIVDLYSFCFTKDNTNISNWREIDDMLRYVTQFAIEFNQQYDIAFKRLEKENKSLPNCPSTIISLFIYMKYKNLETKPITDYLVKYYKGKPEAKNDLLYSIYVSLNDSKEMEILQCRYDKTLAIYRSIKHSVQAAQLLTQQEMSAVALDVVLDSKSPVSAIKLATTMNDENKSLYLI